MSKRALISGITGQDGFYLSEFLHQKGYAIYGLVRRTSGRDLGALRESIRLVPGDLLDTTSLIHAVEVAEPDEVYHLAAFTHVGESFNQPVSCFEQTGLGALRMLEAVRMVAPRARYYQASSSEQFGNAPAPQNEETPMHPRSPYGVAKLAAHAATVNYRESYGLFACCGILFNHESPRRGVDFVTRKIARAAARGERVQLGNIDAKRDWGWAPDYVRAMWLMLQQPDPDDYVIATGESHSVLDFCSLAYGRLQWPDMVSHDSALLRPADIETLVGDASKARQELGWEPTMSFPEIVRAMVDAERDRSENPGVSTPSPSRVF